MDLNRIYFAGIERPRLRRKAPRFVELPSARRPQSLIPQENAALDPFLAWILEQAHLDPAAYRTKALQRRLPACLRFLRASSIPHAKTALEQSPELLPGALNTLLIGVSEFFRDAAVFDYLRATALPSRIRDGKIIRVLSAGCSDGQELYSMAMLLDELGALHHSELLGVDCRCRAIACARAAHYELTELEKIDVRWRNKYFFNAGSSLNLLPHLRHSVTWKVADLLAHDFAPSSEPWDIILFRNVGIYLEASTTARLWERLTRWLAPDGLLITGKAEKPPADSPLKRVFPSVYQKTTS